MSCPRIRLPLNPSLFFVNGQGKSLFGSFSTRKERYLILHSKGKIEKGLKMKNLESPFTNFEHSKMELFQIIHCMQTNFFCLQNIARNHLQKCGSGIISSQSTLIHIKIYLLKRGHIRLQMVLHIFVKKKKHLKYILDTQLLYYRYSY